MTLGMAIGKTAEHTGLTIDTIRFYQKIGLIRQPARAQSGYRFFDDDAVHELEFVRQAQELGFSLNQIKELLVLRHDQLHACAKVRGLLQQKIGDVTEKLQQLQNLQAQLKRAARKCDLDLRINKGSAHAECCPLLQELERPRDKAGIQRHPATRTRKRKK